MSSNLQVVSEVSDMSLGDYQTVEEFAASFSRKKLLSGYISSDKKISFRNTSKGWTWEVEDADFEEQNMVDTFHFQTVGFKRLKDAVEYVGLCLPEVDLSHVGVRSGISLSNPEGILLMQIQKGAKCWIGAKNMKFFKDEQGKEIADKSCPKLIQKLWDCQKYN